MTNGEFAEVFPPKLYEAFPALALFNPTCRDVTIGVIRIASAANPEQSMGAILDHFCTEPGVIDIANAVFAQLHNKPDFGIA